MGRRKPRSSKSQKRWVQRCVDIFVRSLGLQSLLYGVGMFICAVVNLITYYQLQMLNRVSYAPLEIALFGPVVSNGLYVIVVGAFLVKKVHLQRSAFRVKASIVFLLLITAINYAVVYYSIAQTVRDSMTLNEVGELPSTDLTDSAYAVQVNDFLLAMFQSCCVDRGWALFSIPSCNSSDSCIYASVESGICSCYISQAAFDESLGQMTTEFCENFIRSQTLNLIGPPWHYLGCGATTPLTGLPNRFQALFASLYRISLRKGWISAMVIVGLWTLTQVVGYSIRFYRYHLAQKAKRKRAKRRKMLFTMDKESERKGLLEHKDADPKSFDVI